MSGTTDPACLPALVRERFGLETSDPVRFEGEFDENFRVRDPDGGFLLLKLGAADADHELSRWHEDLLVHLESRTLPFALPRLHPALDGRRHALVTIDGRERALRVMSWVGGELLSHNPIHTPALLDSLGTAAAHLGRALEDAPSPPERPPHHWVLERARAELAALAPSLDGDEARLIHRLLDWTVAMPPLDALPRGIVHQDLHDENVFVAADRVVGVIDVNDACRTIRIADPVIAAAYAMVRQPHPVDAFTRVMRAYDRILPLEPLELDAAWPLGLLRLGLNAATWRVRMGAAAGGYAAQRSAHTWPLLRALVDDDLDARAARVRAALGPDR